MIAVVVPYFDRLHFLEALLAGLQRQTFQDFRVIVVSHGPHDRRPSSPPSLDVVWIRGRTDEWWSKTVNRGIGHALRFGHEISHVLLLNDDVTISPEYLEYMAAGARHHPRGLLGSALSLATSGTPIEGLHGVSLWRCKFYAREITGKAKIVSTQALSGRGMLVPLDALRQLGGVRANRFPHYLADIDFSMMAAEAGWSLHVALQAVVVSAPTRGISATKVIPDRRFFSRDSTSNVRDHFLFFSAHGPWYLRASVWFRLPLAAAWRNRRSFWAKSTAWIPR